MGHQEMYMLWKETAQVGMAMTTITMGEDEDYPAEGAGEEWEWDPEAELWLNTAAINKNSSVKCNKMWKIWTFEEGLSHEYGSCEVLQMWAEWAHWCELHRWRLKVRKLLTIFQALERVSGAAKAKPAAKARRGKGWSQRKDA